MTTPVLSVVSCSYNHERFIDACAASVLQARDVDFEWVVHEDASTDGTRDKLRAWAARDDRLRLSLGERNFGNRRALACAVAQAKAPLIAILDTDDEARPERWHRTLAAMEAHPSWIGLFGEAEFIDAEGRPVTAWLHARDQTALRRMAEFGMPAVFSTSAWRTAWLRESIEGTVFPAVMDYYLLARALGEGEVGWLPAVLSRYRMHADNQSHRLRPRQFARGTAQRLWVARDRGKPKGEGAEWLHWADALANRTKDEGTMDDAAAREAWRRGLARLAVYHARRAIRRGRWATTGLVLRLLISPRAWQQNVGSIWLGGWLGGAGIDRNGYSRR